MAFKTLVLQLYKPSQFKQGLLATAQNNYCRALQYLLETYRDAVVKLAEAGDNVSRGQLLKLIDRDTLRKLNAYQVQPFKDSLKIEFAATAAAFIAKRRKNKNSGYPAAHEAHALYYGRYAVNRDFCLLYDTYTGRFYAKLYLLNLASALSSSPGIGKLSLTYVAAGMPAMPKETGRKRYIITPLAMGKNQYNDLQQALAHPETLHTARLYQKSGKYYLAVNMECAAAPSLQTAKTMGIARDCKGGVHYAVAGPDGKILAGGSLAAENGNQKLFILAKKIVAIAAAYQAQVIVEASGGKGDKVLGRENNPFSSLTVGEYARLAAILRYKLPAQKLPPPLAVSANGLYWTCPRCGRRAKKNCLSDEIFACVECGFASPLQAVGSLNLAVSLKKYEGAKVPIYTAATASGRVFYNQSLGFRYVLPPENTGLDSMYGELSLLAHTALKYENDKKKYGLLEKLRRSPTVRDAVRIVAKSSPVVKV
jgi:putative transposase